MIREKQNLNSRYLLCVLVLLAVLIFGEEGEAKGIFPLDVLAQVALFREELDLVRLKMGKPKEDWPEVQVSNAAPRNVFSQALILFQNANRLSFQVTGEYAPFPTTPTGNIRSKHVFSVVVAALDRLLIVKKGLGITQSAPKPTKSIRRKRPFKVSSDVYRSVVQTNRQLELILQRKSSSSDVFAQVTVATKYAALLSKNFPEVKTRLPKAPAFKRFKTSKHVYTRLFKSFALIQGMAKHSGFAIINLEREKDLRKIVPSDLFHIISMIVSELAYFNLRAGEKQVFESEHIKPKIPAHVYQQVGILEKQLRVLWKEIENQPNWHKKGK